MSDCVTAPVIDHRHAALTAWVAQCFPGQSVRIVPVTGDASFRRYFRIFVDDQPYIAMDAPPALEDCRPFVAIANGFVKSTVRLPHIYFSEYEQGFLLLSDFGDQQLLPLLIAETCDRYYGQAIDTLILMQRSASVSALPLFDDVLFWREFDIFLTWYLKTNLQKKLSDAEETALHSQYQLLIDSASAQPQVFVHRDYHSRNLMVCHDEALGVLDFQDAVIGPITYDLVSILRDCYIDWPLEKIEKWALSFYQQLDTTADFATFMKWFDWMGLQRHLKCLGIFSRLCYRDQKNGYLKDIPRVLNYALTVCDRYPELSLLGKLLR